MPFELFPGTRVAQGIAFDVLGDDEQRLFLLRDQLQKRHQAPDIADLVFKDEDKGVLEFARHRILVGNEVRRQIAAIELHALDDDNFGFSRLAFLDGDDAVGGADQFPGLGKFLADFLVAIGGDGGDFGNRFHVVGVDLLSEVLQLLDYFLDALLDAAHEAHRIVAGRDRLQALAIDELRQHGRRRGAVAGHVGSFRGGFLDELRPHVFVGALQFDFFGDSNAVFGNGRAAPAFVENGIAAARPQSRADGPGQFRDARKQFLASFIGVRQLLGSHFAVSFKQQA